MYRIRYSDGRKAECETRAEAIGILGRECEVVEECGDRWLGWDTESAAENDNGANAVAEIVKVGCER